MGVGVGGIGSSWLVNAINVTGRSSNGFFFGARWGKKTKEIKK